MTPYRCPVCLGTGLVSRPPGIAGDLPTWESTDTGPYSCRACRGTGIVWEDTPAEDDKKNPRQD